MILQSAFIQETLFSRRMETQRSNIADLLRAGQKSGMISFAGGLPAPELFPVQEIAECAAAVLSTKAASALQYGLTEGIPELRGWVSGYLNSRGCKYGADDVVVTSGSQQALDLLGRVFIDPGDTILIEAPSYIGAIQAFNTFEPYYVAVRSDEHGLVPDSLEDALRRCGASRPKFLYVVPNFSNPAGRTLSAARRLRIAELCERAGVPIVEDDPYGELRFEGDHIPPICSLGSSVPVIYCGSASKIVAPGMRVGWIATNSSSVRRKLIASKQAADLQTGSFAQHLLYEYVRDEQRFEQRVRAMAEFYGTRCKVMFTAIEQHFGAPYEVQRPLGGFFLWVTLHGIDTTALFESAHAKNVLFVPGELFFPVDHVKSAIRLSFSSTPNNLIIEGIRRLGDLLAG